MFHPPFCFQLNRSPEPPGRRVGALWPWRFWPRSPTSAARSGLGVSGAARRPKWTSQAPRPGCQGKRGRDTSILLKWNCMPQTHRHTHIYIPTTYMYVYIYIYYFFVYIMYNSLITISRFFSIEIMSLYNVINLISLCFHLLCFAWIFSYIYFVHYVLVTKMSTRLTRHDGTVWYLFDLHNGT